jgi:hypothetical protein
MYGIKKNHRRPGFFVVAVAFFYLICGSQSAFATSGSEYHPLYGSDATWISWNGNSYSVFITGVGWISPYVAWLEARKGANNSTTCVDAVFDWTVSNGHFDARVLRSCRGGGSVKSWVKTESTPSGFTFTGLNRRGACYLTGAASQSHGWTGTNVSANTSQRTSGCSGIGTLTNTVRMGLDLAGPNGFANKCTWVRVYNFSNNLIETLGGDARDCTS